MVTDIFINCPCGRRLKASSAFIGRSADCPYCGRLLPITAVSQPPLVMAEIVEPEETRAERWARGARSIPEYREPPSNPVSAAPRAKFSWKKLFEALLDPRSIQWMLAIGGALAVLGLLIWLGSLGLFKNVLFLAIALAIGNLAILAAGWWLVLATRYQTAGRALTMLGCLVAPLNLWFYHSQNLVRLEDNLWIGGVVCCLIYLATVWMLRDSLFLYAFEGGITLTATLLLAENQHAGDTACLSGLLMVLGLASIHAQRAFPPEAPLFTRSRFGMPLFWSGQVQVAAALLILLGTQVFWWLINPVRNVFSIHWQGNLLIHSDVLPAGLWLAGAYAYFYSDLVVRRIGFYLYLASICLLLAGLTLFGLDVGSEWLIIGSAGLGLAVNVLLSRASKEDPLTRAVRPIAFVASFVPILLGLWIHARTTSSIVPHSWRLETGWLFAGAMLVAAVSSRMSAWLLRATRWTPPYLLTSAAAVLLACAAALRALGLEYWLAQAPWLMLVAIAYIVAAYLWRGHDPEEPLGVVGHVATALIVLVSCVLTLWYSDVGAEATHPQLAMSPHLYLAVVFVEAALFYVLAAIVRRRSFNIHLAAAATCGAIWQLMTLLNVTVPYQTIAFTIVGLATMILGRIVGVREATVYDGSGQQGKRLEGQGRATFHAGNVILLIALLAVLIQHALALLNSVSTAWIAVAGLCIAIVSSLMAGAISLQQGWRRFYVTMAVALGAVLFLTLQVLIDLTTGQKLEIFATAAGLILVVIGYAGRFRETESALSDGITLALWLGSLLATVPVLIATTYYRAPGHDISAINELALLAITIVLLVTGLSFQVKATTIFGGTVLVLYLMLVILSLGWRNQVAVGIYLTVGGGVVFAVGVALSIYRERLLELPARISRREGIFKIFTWR